MSGKKDPTPTDRMTVADLVEMLGRFNPKRRVRVILDDTDGPLRKADGLGVVDVAAENYTVWLVARPESVWEEAR
jgi:hypothetical protein